MKKNTDDILGDDPKLKPKNFTLSPNDLARCEVCPRSRVFVGPRPKPNPAMWYGIFVHRFLEYVVTRGRKAALDYVKSKRQKHVINVCEKIDVLKIPLGIPELPIAINTESMSCNADEREFTDPSTHIYGKLDLAYCDEQNLWNVWDYKTGEKEDDPRSGMQVITLCLGISLMHSVESVVGSIVQVRKNGDLVPLTTTFTRCDLEKHAKRVRRIHLETLETRAEFHEEKCSPDVVPSPMCWGCRALPACPEGSMFLET